MKTVRPEDLGKALAAELHQYETGVSTKLGKEIRSVARQSLKKLKETSPKKTGDYAASWASKTESFTKPGSVKLYVKDPEYRLTHLLEKGHAKVNGGRVGARTHIAPVEREAIAKLKRKVKVIVQR